VEQEEAKAKLVAEKEVAVQQAKTALEELDRKASLRGIPFEWRR